MCLCVFIGAGPVGEHVAHQLRSTARLIGLRATRGWLRTIATDVEFVTVLSFQRSLSLLKYVDATAVAFAGKPNNSYGLPDRLAMGYMWKVRQSFRIPHAYLAAVKAMLRDNNIDVRSIVDIVPTLGADPGVIAGPHTDYDPASDMSAARAYSAHQPWWSIRQAHIVDAGRVLKSEEEGTDNLIMKFGKSKARRTAKFPVLCKVALPPFEDIDAPTIGARTIQLCIENGVRGIVIEARKAILMDRQEVTRLAHASSLCVIAV